MTARVLGLLVVLGMLALSAYTAVDRWRDGTLSPARHVTEAEAQAELASAQYVLGVVASELERVRVVSGTYDNGLDLGNFPLVRLVRADESSYCLEFEKTQTFVREGPGGATALGTCP